MSIAAIVVTYQPQEVLLLRVLKNLIPQVDQIYLIDNTPLNAEGVGVNAWFNAAWLQSFGGQIDYQPLGSNYGIAKAQNIGFELALKASCEEILFFDQDSYPPSNLVAGLLQARFQVEKQGEQVGAIGPAILDEKSQVLSPVIRTGTFWVKAVHYPRNWGQPIPTDYIISSGSLISAKVMRMVGPMLEKLFIDWVDVEWGLRAQQRGYVNYVAPNVIMRHSIGDECVRVGNKTINLHSETRNYYIVRNACYLVRNSSLSFAWRFTVGVKIPIYIIFYSYTSKGSIGGALIALLKAAYHGWTGKMGAVPLL